MSCNTTNFSVRIVPTITINEGTVILTALNTATNHYALNESKELCSVVKCPLVKGRPLTKLYSLEIPGQSNHEYHVRIKVILKHSNTQLSCVALNVSTVHPNDEMCLHTRANSTATEVISASLTTFSMVSLRNKPGPNDDDLPTKPTPEDNDGSMPPESPANKTSPEPKGPPKGKRDPVDKDPPLMKQEPEIVDLTEIPSGTPTRRFTATWASSPPKKTRPEPQINPTLEAVSVRPTIKSGLGTLKTNAPQGTSQPSMLPSGSSTESLSSSLPSTSIPSAKDPSSSIGTLNTNAPQTSLVPPVAWGAHIASPNNVSHI